ncbi:thiamine pyrophosphate-binding protein [Phytohabitans sp. ZYX-F-186]|uniref:Thiamine pyrophosphate-binding protein n=1 Tax=Phytohabitans maris TaxID=3071409 RepID=A0ABU0ZWG2_9ACTN|nr:thiamine pyrophosphate-binding protein [Phytohabitans sp. ZYX-F-186]MDQ7911273.1 thiamine pyrophosphate-binding protein [Phytohabitans sp. ZYX-F-186]
MKLHDALARALADNGVDTLFGLTGDANLFLVDHFIRECGGTYVSAAHEAGAVLMAHGYASVTGRIGVATVTHGPAFTNTVTALIEGVRSRTPLVLIAGDTPVVDTEHIQAVDQRAVVLGTGVGFEQVRAIETAVTDLGTALRRADVERRPIVLNVPVDFVWQESGYERVDVLPVPAQAPGPDPAALDSAIGVIASARRPLVLAGRGATSPRARAALLRLADRLGAPLATTLKGKDLFRGEAFDLGIFGTLSTAPAVEAILDADCVIAFGASLNKWTTAVGAYLDGKAVVQCDLDRGAIGRYGPVAAGIVGDAGAVAETIAAWLDEAEVPATAFRSPALAAKLAGYDPGDYTDQSSGETVDERTVLRRLEEAVPADRTLVTDGGQFIFNALKILHVPEPEAFVLGVNFGSIGLGMGNAIGAAVGAPHRPALMLCGDGGFMLGGLVEFNSAVRAGVDLIAVVFNNRCYGPEYVHFVNHGRDPSLSMFDWPDFAGVAESLGGRGFTVRNLADLDRLPKLIADRDRPLLIDVHLDPALTPTEREQHRR